MLYAQEDASRVAQRAAEDEEYVFQQAPFLFAQLVRDNPAEALKMIQLKFAAGIRTVFASFLTGTETDLPGVPGLLAEPETTEDKLSDAAVRVCEAMTGMCFFTVCKIVNGVRMSIMWYDPACPQINETINLIKKGLDVMGSGHAMAFH